jgi:hypothetical protein
MKQFALNVAAILVAAHIIAVEVALFWGFVFASIFGN